MQHSHDQQTAVVATWQCQAEIQCTFGETEGLKHKLLLHRKEKHVTTAVRMLLQKDVSVSGRLRTELHVKFRLHLFADV